MTASRLIVGVALALMALSGSAAAQLKDENFLVSMPQGFKVASSQTRNGVVFQEWIPSSESFPNWSEMVVMQILLGRGDVDGGRYLGEIKSGWLRACPETRPNDIAVGRVNGYPMWSMLLQCPKLSTTGKPETTLFRSIRGKDSFYSVQRSSRTMPDRGKLGEMQAYVDGVTVCDTRAAEHPCPDLGKQGFKPVR